MPDLLFADLSLAAQTNFAELVEQAQASTVARSIADVPGSFNKKDVKGCTYWYWQFRDLHGAVKQVYLGPDDARMRELILQREAGKAAPQADLAGLAAACVSLGCMEVFPQHFRVINRMAEHGFFRAGGTLIGTHAFVAMSNMLGVRWRGGWRTNDIDFAHPGKNVSLALPATVESNVHDTVTSLEMGLLPAQSITRGSGATYFTAKKDLRVDLLTTIGRVGGTYRYEPLNVNLEPLKFMEFSLERTTQTVIVSGQHALVVNIPSPMRYALHKLLVMAEREDSFRMKVRKDAAQVAALVSYGLERSPHALQLAAADIMGRGKGWRSRIKDGLGLLATFHPQTAQDLGKMLGDRPQGSAPAGLEALVDAADHERPGEGRHLP